VPKRNEVHVLGELVNHTQDDTLTIDVEKTFDEVHCHVSPHDGWHIDELQQAYRMDLLWIVSLASGARSHEVLNHHLCSCHVEVEVQTMQGIGDALMAHPVGGL
jgi:hypothetical protein